MWGHGGRRTLRGTPGWKQIQPRANEVLRDGSQVGTTWPDRWVILGSVIQGWSWEARSHCPRVLVLELPWYWSTRVTAKHVACSLAKQAWEPPCYHKGQRKGLLTRREECWLGLRCSLFFSCEPPNRSGLNSRKRWNLELIRLGFNYSSSIYSAQVILLCKTWGFIVAFVVFFSSSENGDKTTLWSYEDVIKWYCRCAC